LFAGYQAGYNNTTGSSNIYIGNPGCPSPYTESNTIRIGSQGTGRAQQNATYVAGIYGSTASGGTPVDINSNSQLGASSGGSFTVYNQNTTNVPAVSYGQQIVQCPTDHPHLLSGTWGFYFDREDLFMEPSIRWLS